MKKEVILAIVFGLIVGLAVTFGIYFSKHRNDQISEESATTRKIILEPVDPNQDQNQEPTLVKITAPENESVQTEKSIVVTGISIPEGFTVIFVNDKEIIITTDSSGTFQAEVELESGSNIVGAYSVGEDGETYHDQVTIIYSNKSLEENLVSDSEVKVEADKQN